MVNEIQAGVPLRSAMRAVQAMLLAAGCPEPDVDARELVRLAAGQDPLRSERLLTAPQAAQLQADAARRAARTPLQYIEGHWPFLDFELAVGEGVLCPRSDTEIVCEAAAETLRGKQRPAVLDLCAGSGCLGIGLRRFCPDAQVTALEKSPEALYYLRQNAEKALLEKGIAAPAVQVQEGDVFAFQAQLAPESLDLIVSNPPYLTAEEMQHLQPEVAKEPAMALDGGEDGGVFYRHIAAAYGEKLKKGGWMVLEIGCAQQAQLREILAACGWTARVECRRDYGGNDRVILAQRGMERIR